MEESLDPPEAYEDAEGDVTLDQSMMTGDYQ